MEEYIPGIDITVGLMNGKVMGMIEVITEQEYMITTINIIIIIQIRYSKNLDSGINKGNL